MTPDVWATCGECGHIFNATTDRTDHHAEDCPIRQFREDTGVPV